VTPPSDPRLSVAVITHERRDELLRTLASLVALPERPHVVVVDNASTDGTAAAVAARFPSVELVVAERNLGAVARNVAVERLSTPYVAFCDDDTWWEPGSLALAADVLDAHPSVAVVTAHIVVEPSGVDDPVNLDMRVSPLPRPEGIPGHPLISFLAGASVVRRSAFRDAGGFSSRLWLGGEEELLSWDLATAGWHLTHVPGCVVHHHPSRARDAHLRRRHGIRNTLWTAWLRRPWGTAVRRTLQTVRTAPKDRVTAWALLDAVAGLRWVLFERRVLPAHVEHRIALLDPVQLATGSRRYVS
jgi:GT2 family glycosyltransferase